MTSPCTSTTGSRGWSGTLWLAFLTFCLSAPGPSFAFAQDATPEGVRAVIDRVFAGMHAADSARVRSAFAEGARFALLREREGSTTLEYVGIDGWLRAIANSGGRWEERVFDVEVRVDDTLASVWAPYVFYLDGELHHCGVNSIELLRGPEGWTITQLSDTQRTEGCVEGR